MTFDLLQSLHLILPELVLITGALLILLVGAFLQGPNAWNSVGYACFGVFVLAFLASLRLETGEAFGGQVVNQPITAFLRSFIIVFAAASYLLIHADLERDHDLRRTETPVLVLLAVAGMGLMVSSGSMMTLYMGLELQSLSLYVLAATKRDSLKASEAGLKYFVLGALSSGILLFGISFVYGATGSFSYDVIAKADPMTNSFLLLGMCLILLGLAFKVSLVPFHMWTPDVYEGAPIGVTAFFAAAPKVAAIGVFAVLLRDVFAAGFEVWSVIIAILAVASTWWGALGAMRQVSLKRILAYSSIANMGFAFLGFLSGPDGDVGAVVTYAVIYAVMTIGGFAAISAIRLQGRVVQERAHIKGLAKTHPKMALILALLLFSMAGIPPLAGFFAKFAVFIAALDGGMVVVAILAILASVVGSFYYLRLVVDMYMQEPLEELTIAQPIFLAGVGAVLVSLFVFAPWILMDSVEAVAKIAP